MENNKSINVKFNTNGSSVTVVSLNPDTIKDTLAPKVYSLRSSLSGFYLEILRDNFNTPKKIYGDHSTKVNKILNTYDARSKSTGIVLSGDKGSGKSLILELTCNKAIAEKNLPIITINQAYGGDAFLEFIDKLGECVLVFDEFDKIYSNGGDSAPDDGEENSGTGPQESLLTLLEGLYSRKRLVLLSANDDYKVNRFLKNRPGRIYYYIKFRKLEEKIVKDYCKDKNIPDNITKEIINVRKVSREFSFDILQALVEEYLRFQPAKLADVLSDLNIEMDVEYEIKVLKVINKNTDEVVKGLKVEHVNIESPQNGSFYLQKKGVQIPVYVNDTNIVQDDCLIADQNGYLVSFQLNVKEQRDFMRYFGNEY